MKYDIFISYKRRGVSISTAAYLYDFLQQRGYNVFYDRKEMRSGKFDEQLLEHIGNATDIIILLEEGSLDSWFLHRPRLEGERPENDDAMGGPGSNTNSQEEPYKSDWFCKEIIHALSLAGKNVVPILLNGYQMPGARDLPPEMAGLSVQNALELDINKLNELYEDEFIGKGYLYSKPANLSMAQRFRAKGGIVGCFLFYTETPSCDISECGEKITTLTDDNDEKHPFRYPVNFAGEHRFQAFNNDTCEDITVSCSVETNCQQYVQVKFNDTRNLWELKPEEIQAQEDAGLLYRWGRGLFDGTSRHEPDIARSFECFSRAIDLGSQEALDFVSSYGTGLISEKHAPIDVVVKWYGFAAERGNRDAQRNLGHIYSDGEGVEQDVELAMTWYTRAASGGDQYAQVRLAEMYFSGEGGEQDYGKAFEWFAKAAEQGDVLGESNLGNMYQNGFGTDQDYVKAMEWYLKAAAKGDTYSMRRIGYLYEDGLGIEKDTAKAFEWFLKAAEAGSLPAQRKVGHMYEYGYGVEKDPAKAFEWYQRAVERGDPFSLVKVGDFYDEGLVVDQDHAKAIECYEKAAEDGDEFGIKHLALLYEQGDGVDQDFGKAFDLYLKGAEKGDAFCLGRLGDLYNDGLGVAQDYVQARECYLKAAEQGDSHSMGMLGHMFQWGVGVGQDYAQAMEWYLKAAGQNNAFAMSRIAWMYECGLGVAQDYRTALEWYLKAEENGLQEAKNSIAWMYHMLGDYESALPWAEKAIVAVPDDPNVVDTLATVYEGLGRYDEALEQFEKCLRMFEEAGDEEAKQRTADKIEALKAKMKQ